MGKEAYSLCVKFNGGADCPFTRQELPKSRRQARSYARHSVYQLLQNRTKNLIIQNSNQKKKLKNQTQNRNKPGINPIIDRRWNTWMKAYHRERLHIQQVFHCTNW